MSLHLVVSWLHLVLGVGVAGMALFWAIMGRSLTLAHAPDEAQRLLEIAGSARWPHVGLPEEARLPLGLVGLLILVLYALTGLMQALLSGAGSTLGSGIKAVLVIALLGVFRFLFRRPTPLMGYVALVLALALVADAALMQA